VLGNYIDRMDLRSPLASSRTWPGMLLPVAREKDAWGGECRNCRKGDNIEEAQRRMWAAVNGRV
jgi:hypothetical protein